jgi:hypothetical protein
MTKTRGGGPVGPLGDLFKKAGKKSKEEILAALEEFQGVDVESGIAQGNNGYSLTRQSRAAIAMRWFFGRGIKTGQNISIYTVRLKSGKAVDLGFINTPIKEPGGEVHSEPHGDEILRQLGFKDEDVLGVYSERAFCSGENKCAGRMSAYTSAKLSWSFESGDNAAQQIFLKVFGLG